MEPRKPFLLRILAALAGVGAAGVGVVIVLAVAGVSGPYVVDGDEVPRAEYLQRAVPSLLLAGVVAGLAGWGLWTERRWARHLFVAGWFLLLARVGFFLWNDPAIDADEMFETVFAIVMGAPVIWYFYFKRGVAMYYRALARRGSRPTA